MLYVVTTVGASLAVSDRVASLTPSATLAVTARTNAMKAQGMDVIGFGAGQPDFDTPEPIKQAAIASLLAGHTKYMPTPGPPEAREAIAAKLRDENAIACDAVDIVITVGAKHAMFLTLQTVVNPGREVILPTPAWVTYRPMIELAGGKPIELPGAFDNDFKITPKQLEGAISDRTAAIILNSPCNPTGAMYDGHELRALADVLARHPHVVAITDEIYEKIVFGGRPVSLGSFADLTGRVVTINGLSKAFAMTGWRMGYLCAPGGDGSIAAAASRLQDKITGNITSFCYAAIIEALTKCREHVETMREVFAQRAALMFKLVAAMPDLPCPKPAGAFYLFPDIRGHLGKRTPGGQRIATALAFAEALLAETGVAVVPGEDFGECAKTHIRLSFATSDEQIREGCGRIDGWLRALR